MASIFQKGGKKKDWLWLLQRKKNYFSVVGNIEVLLFEGKYTNKSNWNVAKHQPIQFGTETKLSCKIFP